jgi:hypothetical protein
MTAGGDPMRLLDTLTVSYQADERRVEIYEGDLTALTPAEAVDVLIVSAFPDDYVPTPGSLIGALDRKGVSVARLAQDKAADLRKEFSCWMSHDIVSQDPGIQFRRILCFEPAVRGTPPQVVGDIFRSLAPFIAGDPPIHTVAMPLVATGDARLPVRTMIEPLLDAAVHWMAIGLPLARLKVVARATNMAQELADEFARLKKKYRNFSVEPNRRRYDLFVSYSRDDSRDASLVVEELQQLRPRLRVFFDRMTLDHGSAWQQEVYEAIDASRRFLAMFSPSYLTSKICMEEFNIALHRRRDTGEEILFPIYLYSAALPTYMRALVNYEDCREGDAGKLRQACQRLVS